MHEANACRQLGASLLTIIVQRAVSSVTVMKNQHALAVAALIDLHIQLMAPAVNGTPVRSGSICSNGERCVYLAFVIHLSDTSMAEIVVTPLPASPHAALR